MATLTGQTIASTYDALLKVTDNGPITSSLKLITDGLGNNTALSLSNVAASINGNVTATSFIKSSGTSTQYLMADGSVSTLTNPITGTGTTNTLPKFTGASALGNSNITDSGTLISLGSNTTISSGGLGIGTSLLTGYIIRIASNLTGATSTFGVNNSPTIQSDVTLASRLFRTNFSTAAASFTLANLYHFIAEQATIGAGSVVTSQYGFFVDASLIGATNNYGFRGQIPSSLNNYNLFMNGTAANYLAGDVGIGVAASTTSSGPILTTTLTNGGSGYVDGTYTDVASTVISSGGVYALFTVVVSGGIVTSATLTWGGSTYKVGETLTVSNTLLGGTGSGLIITVATVDSSQLKIANANGGDITLYRSDTSLTTGDNIGSIKFENNDASSKASGINAKISAFGAAAAGGAYLSFFTRPILAGSSLVEAMRIDSTGALGIGATFLTAHNLRVDKNITGGSVAHGIYNGGQVQSDVLTQARYYTSAASTQATTFTCADLRHYLATQGTFGAGSTVSLQHGFMVDSTLIGGTSNFGFRGQIPAAANRWNIYMDGTANNYIAGNLGIGSTSLTQYNLRLEKSITGNVTSFSFYNAGIVQSDVTSTANYNATYTNTQATTFTLTSMNHYNAIQGVFGVGSTVTNQAGFRVDSSLIGATNNYGFRGLIPSGTNRWNIYMDGTADNYMAGALGIGTTSLTGYSLRIAKTLTGATTTHGILQTGQIQSDVTGNAIYNRTLPSTQAAAFTLANLYHYFADQSTFGAGSSVTNQFGFFVDSGLIGATNNYGFRGNIPSGTGRWNLYMDGTASNYINGTTLIGSTTDNGSGAKLQVTGNVTFQNIFNRRTASYTLALTDQNDIVEMNVATANNLTVPLNSSVAFPIGTEIAVLQYGVGQTTIVATGGVTLRAKSGALKISGQYAGCTLVKVGTDEWYVIGDLTV